MVRFFALLLVFFSTLSFAEPLYWGAQKGKTQFMIVGSIHVGEQNMYPLPKAVTQFLKSSDGLIVEADIRKFSPSDLPAPTVKTEQVLDAKSNKELKSISQKLGLDVSILQKSPPWATALTLQIGQFKELGLSPALGVDHRVMALAEMNSVPIIGLETVGFQFSLLTDLPDGGKSLLKNTLDEFDKSFGYSKCLVKAWKAGDKTTLDRFAEQTSFSRDFDNKFIFSRNRDWAKKLSSKNFLPVNDGKYLIVVGALHLVGKDNLLTLLKRRGFTVKQLSSSEQAHCKI
ncbi:TraB/GumN family protein [Vibrio marisflavi]|uniref:TraB/GumN family protein n=1 Tax=Vibrio marisflavi CECT 7928 TaxID=634439 RepID=A0ABM9A6W3_9VIBR|nr:TraB/GumN family protein [Vibrio marisflavi]CAH0540948.1 hypothetical protein VMF7928_03250 [Vibrio marisflavi CECT 7928]